MRPAMTGGAHRVLVFVDIGLRQGCERIGRAHLGRLPVAPLLFGWIDAAGQQLAGVVAQVAGVLQAYVAIAAQ